MWRVGRLHRDSRVVFVLRSLLFLGDPVLSPCACAGPTQYILMMDVSRDVLP
jgi:hypothetical protein